MENVTLDYADVELEPAITLRKTGFFTASRTSEGIAAGLEEAKIINGGSLSVPCGGTIFIPEGEGSDASQWLYVSIMNSVANDGGAICLKGSRSRLTLGAATAFATVSLSNNHAANNGGAVYAEGTTHFGQQIWAGFNNSAGGNGGST